MFGFSSLSWGYPGYTYGLQAARKAAGTSPIEPVERAVTTPVAPVDPVGAVQPKQPQLTAGTEMPSIREGADPVEMAVRGRIKPYEPAEAPLSLADMEKAKGAETAGEDGKSVEKAPSAQEVMEEAECQTCKKRKYQDGSDDPGVSFKTPTNVSPEMAASAVRGHEQEHVVREQAKAQREDRRVVSQSVTYHTEICPECGKVYVAGGTTRTVTAANPEEESQNENNQPYAPFAAVM